MLAGRAAAERARWLAELSDTLDEAQRLLHDMGVGTTESPLAMELYLRIEGARFAVQALRLRPNGILSGQSAPKWTEASPWQKRDGPET